MRKASIFFLLLFCCFGSSLSAAATISGVVTNQSSNPISGASMALIKGSQNVVATTTTAVDGSYAFNGINPGKYSVRASAVGFQTQIVGAKAQNNQTTVVNFQLLSNPGSISGRVVDATTSLPISGATILATQNNFEIGSATSDLNGNYTISGLDPGSYTVSAAASNYQTALQGTIVQGGQTSSVNFSLNSAPGSVAGNVTASNTGLPIAGAVVDVTFDDQIVKSTLTDSSGNYAFSGLSPGAYEVVVHSSNFQTKESAVNVQSNQTSVVNFSLDPFPGILSGTIIDANTSLPILGAAVFVYFNNQLIDEDLTDASGNYTIDDLAPGSYEVLATATNYQRQILPATLLANQTTTLNFSLQSSPSSLQGQITDTLTGQPIKGAAVMLFQNGLFEAVAFSDSSGNYLISSLSSGNYSLTVSSHGFYSVSTSFSIGVSETKTVNLSLMPNSPPRNLSGSVIKNRYLLQQDRIHHLQWNSSQDPTVLIYRIFRNGMLIATISAQGALEYDDHLRSSESPDLYLVDGVNANGNVSSSVSITLR